MTVKHKVMADPAQHKESEELDRAIENELRTMRDLDINVGALQFGGIAIIEISARLEVYDTLLQEVLNLSTDSMTILRKKAILKILNESRLAMEPQILADRAKAKLIVPQNILFGPDGVTPIA